MKKMWILAFICIVCCVICLIGCERVRKQKEEPTPTVTPSPTITPTPYISHDDLPSIEVGSLEQLEPNANGWITYWIPMMYLTDDKDETISKIIDYGKYEDYVPYVFLGIKEIPDGLIYAYEIMHEGGSRFVLYTTVVGAQMKQTISDSSEIAIVRGTMTFEDYKEQEQKSAALEALEYSYQQNNPTKSEEDNEEEVTE